MKRELFSSHLFISEKTKFLSCNCTMFPIYFHGNHNRYKEHSNTDRANSQQENTLLQCNNDHELCIFTSEVQEPACHAHNNLHHWKWPTVAVSTAEMHHPPLHCAHIHWVVSIKVQQVLMNVTGCHFFHLEEFSDTPLLHLYFHVRCHCVRLPLYCHLSRGNNM